jgi:hypothetical protein
MKDSACCSRSIASSLGPLPLFRRDAPRGSLEVEMTGPMEKQDTIIMISHVSVGIVAQVRRRLR